MRVEARCSRSGEILVAAVTRQRDGPNRRIDGPNPLRDLATIDAGQADIDEGELRALRDRTLDATLAVRGLEEIMARVLENHPQRLARVCIVFDQIR